MIDLNRTLRLIKGGIFDPENTWRDYLPEAENWQTTAFLLTGPLILIAAVVAYLLGFLGSDMSMFGRFRPTVVSTIMTIVSSAIVAVVVAWVVSALAGAFGGKSGFGLGLAATTFAFIPGYIGQALVWLPWVGGLLAFGLFIYGLVLLWKAVPVFLAVPDGKRTGHYILALVASIAAVLILSLTIGRFAGPGVTAPTFSDMSDTSVGDRGAGGAGGSLYSGIARQAELMEAAEEDRYDPPSNGRLSEDQVREFIRVMNRSEELQQGKMKRLEELAEKAERNEDISFSDVGAMMGGMSEVAGLHTSEIEVVKSAGGNWAEHQWVRESLRTAWVQKDVNDAVEHNYELYQEFEDQLEAYITN